MQVIKKSISIWHFSRDSAEYFFLHIYKRRSQRLYIPKVSECVQGAVYILGCLTRVTARNHIFFSFFVCIVSISFPNNKWQSERFLDFFDFSVWGGSRSNYQSKTAPKRISSEATSFKKGKNSKLMPTTTSSFNILFGCLIFLQPPEREKRTN